MVKRISSVLYPNVNNIKIKEFDTIEEDFITKIPELKENVNNLLDMRESFDDQQKIDVLAKLFFYRNALGPIFCYQVKNNKYDYFKYNHGLLFRKEVLDGNIEEYDNINTILTNIHSSKFQLEKYEIIAFKRKKQLQSKRGNTYVIDKNKIYTDYDFSKQLSSASFLEAMKEIKLKPLRGLEDIDEYLKPPIDQLAISSHINGYGVDDMTKYIYHVYNNNQLNDVQQLINKAIKDIPTSSLRSEVINSNDYAGYNVFVNRKFGNCYYSAVEIMEKYYEICYLINNILTNLMWKIKGIKNIIGDYRVLDEDELSKSKTKMSMDIFPNLKLLCIFKNWEDIEIEISEKLDLDLTSYINSIIDQSVKNGVVNEDHNEELNKEKEIKFVEKVYEMYIELKQRGEDPFNLNIANYLDDYSVSCDDLIIDVYKTESGINLLVGDRRFAKLYLRVDGKYGNKIGKLFLEKNLRMWTKMYIKELMTKDSYYNNYYINDKKINNKESIKCMHISIKNIIKPQLIRFGNLCFGISETVRERTPTVAGYRDYLKNVDNNPIWYYQQIRWVEDNMNLDREMDKDLFDYCKYIKDLIIENTKLEYENNISNPFEKINTGKNQLNTYMQHLDIETLKMFKK